MTIGRKLQGRQWSPGCIGLILARRLLNSNNVQLMEMEFSIYGQMLYIILCINSFSGIT